eukprot:6024996-Karenia_brevis.AAC.1
MKSAMAERERKDKRMEDRLDAQGKALKMLQANLGSDSIAKRSQTPLLQSLTAEWGIGSETAGALGSGSEESDSSED